MLNNQRKFVTKVKEQSQNASYIDDFLISNVVSPKCVFSKISIFFWITSGFIFISIFCKIYTTSKSSTPKK
jgi:hypothetical protein